MANTNALRLLESCENGLRELLGRAASRGDYSDVLRLTSWAKVIHSLADDAKTEQAKGPLFEERPKARANTASATVQRSRRSRKATRNSGKADGYPRFLREGDTLVKIGWSRRDSEEYQHKAPHTVLALLMQKLTVVGAGGRLFASEDLMPLHTEHGAEIPNYQVYLCLAWLRSEGLVLPQGRQGYTLKNGENSISSVEVRWQHMKE